MTTDLDWQTVPVGANDLHLVDATVQRIAIALGRLIAGIRANGPGEGSRAAADLASPLNIQSSDGSTHLAHAQASAWIACLAGADHMLAFAAGIRDGRTVSNWTLARGALEAFARARYLLGAEGDDTGALLGRSIALARAEMRYATEPGQMATREGGPLDVDEYRAQLTRMLAELEVDEPKAPGATKLTTDLLDETAPDAGGRRRYSQLSAAAHAESAGIQMFMTAEQDALSMSRPLVLEVTHMQTACCLFLGDILVAYFTPDPDVTKRWEGERNAVLRDTWEHAGVTIDEHGRPVYPDHVEAAEN
ncbi:hypothetical protein LQ757_12385 [Agromyces sp. SYSU K20354]|uniref:hypothetical protein n=1 Tax=Agromyces cavernae TaxID=2898659 RepID=UPI001E4850FA|nr:hypothetical protein [Agromyces cavernae]MCD2443072.1 hypothetical protein [Agromyces cavernae]